MERCKSSTKSAGIDVGKRRLDVAVHGGAQTLVIDNDPAGIGRLIDWLKAQFDAAIETGDLDVLHGLNSDFHDRFYEACNNLTLAQEIKALRQRGLPGARGWRSLGAIRRSNDDHAQMIDFMEAGDGEALSALIDRHLNRWREGPEG
jgi:DNA-binding GntR family transcriptional regulator